MAREMTGAEMVIKALVDQGVTDIFGYPGGAVLPIYDELFQQEDLTHILVRHEQGAVHAAEGYARSTGKVGAVLVTSGPGATNAVTGLTDALMDSIPIVCITGQVPTHLIGNDAFQECDTVGITRPCTKHNYLVKDVEDLSGSCMRRFMSPRAAGPARSWSIFPKDVQFATGKLWRVTEDPAQDLSAKSEGRPGAIREAVELLANAKKPILYSGGGVINSGPAASRLLRDLVKATGYPITSTLMGLGAIRHRAETGSACWACTAPMKPIWRCTIAMSWSASARGSMTASPGGIDAFSPNSTKIHIDIDPSSINKNVHVDLPIIGDCAHVLEDMVRIWKSASSQPDKTAL